MIPVANAENINIYCPNTGRYSFFNSPYPAHKLKTGIDIYTSDIFGDQTPSPVSGIIKEIRKVKAPKGYGFEALEHDTVITMESLENPTKIIKILHIEPQIQIGETIETGQIIGSTIRSGYYGYATSPHIHLEIRKPTDPLRARGGYQLSHITNLENLKKTYALQGEVITSNKDYTLLQISDKNPGLVGTINETTGIIDGGIPYYGWLGFHTDQQTNGKTIRLLNTPIGQIEKHIKNSYIGKSLNYNLTANSEKIRGLSLYLTPNQRGIVKMIHMKRRRQSQFNSVDTVEIKISTTS